MASLSSTPQRLGSTRSYGIECKKSDGTPYAFAGTETLAAALWRGEPSAALAAPAVAFDDAAAGTLTLTIAAADIDGFAAGRYRLTITATPAAGPYADQPLEVGTWDADFADAPGGSTSVAGRYVTLDEVRDAVDATTARRADLGDLLDSALRAVESYCGRKFASAARSRVFTPGRERTIRLPEWPATAIDRLAADPQTLLTVTYSGAAPRATVAFTTTGDPGSEAFTGLSLAAGGTTTPLPFSTYATLDDLAAAIDAASGWSAAVATDYGDWSTGDLAGTIGARGAKGGGASFVGYTTDLDYDLDADGRTIRLIDDFGDAYRHPDRTWGASRRCGGVAWCRWTSGWTAANCPEDLKRAVILTLKTINDRTTLGAFSEKSVGDLKLKVAEISGGTGQVSLPGVVQGLLSAYRRRDIA